METRGRHYPGEKENCPRYRHTNNKIRQTAESRADGDRRLPSECYCRVLFGLIDIFTDDYHFVKVFRLNDIGFRQYRRAAIRYGAA